MQEMHIAFGTYGIMKCNPDIHHRRSIRLRNYDYSLPGAYFLTVCTEDRACLFGNVADDTMRLNDAGRMIEQWWFELNRKFPTVETDEFVVMPNHCHGIVVIPVGADLRVGPGSKGARTAHQGAHAGAPLPTVIQWFKTMTTNDYIRGEDSLNRIRQYIGPLGIRPRESGGDRAGAGERMAGFTESVVEDACLAW